MGGATAALAGARLVFQILSTRRYTLCKEANRCLVTRLFYQQRDILSLECFVLSAGHFREFPLFGSQQPASMYSSRRVYDCIVHAIEGSKP
jgi:hypothetical protein